MFVNSAHIAQKAPSLLAVVLTITVGTIDAESSEVDFQTTVRPILAEHCLECHGWNESERQAELRLDQRTPKTVGVLAPGQVATSELLRRVTSNDPQERMPPAEHGRRLDPTEILLLKTWIEQGAEYREHWAYVTPRRPRIPSVRQTDWPRNPIDRFVLSRLERNSLRPSPEADPRTLFRRLSLDLRGLPPTPAEITSFLRDTRPNTYGRAVERLMTSPHFGERMAQDWLDAARYADTTGHAADMPRTMWVYRDWVIDAINTGMPFDQFTVEQLAGDMLPNPTWQQRVATGFHRNSMQALGNNPRKEEFRVKGIVDRIDTTGRVWMALTLACAECHDHKYDPISMREYYQLFAVFNNVPHYGERFGIHGPRMTVQTTDQRRRMSELQEQLDAFDAQNPIDVNFEELQRSWQDDPRQIETDDPSLVFASGARPRRNDGFAWTDDSPWDKQSLLFGESGPHRPTGIDNTRLRGPLTIALWIKTRDGVVDFVSKYDWRAGQRAFVFGLGGEREVNYPAGHLFVWLSSVANPFRGIEVIGSKSVNDGHWHHVAFSYRPGRSVRLFVDGELDNNARLIGTVPDKIAACDRPFVIGGGYSNSALPNAFLFRGTMHDLRIYDRPFEEVLSLGAASADVRTCWQTPEARRTPAQAKLLRAHIRELSSRRQRSAALAIEAELAHLRRSGVEAQIMDDSMPRETFVHIRGQFEQKGDRVQPGLPGFLPPQPRGKGSQEGQKTNRLTLAKWLVDGQHPLTARVYVNRVWAHYFGEGLVETVEDFGLRGGSPSHPKLLDWLAVEFVASGWDVKRLHRRILTSATYRQSSVLTAQLAKRDPDNRLLARASRFRLPAEQIRDSALFASGLLDRRLGGPSVYPEQPSDVGKHRDATAGSWKTSEGALRHRRGLYTFWQRMSPYPSLTLFDAPSRERSCVQRDRTNTPLQALVTLNDPVYVEIAKALAARVSAESDTFESQLRLAFLVTLCRPPDHHEEREFERFFESQRQQGTPRQQAWFLVAQVLMNSDEAFTRE